MNFFGLLGRRRQQSARAAKERLQLVLIHDRTGITPGRLEALKDDLISTISKHVSIDEGAVEVTLTRDRHQERLVADIPLAPPRMRRRTSR